MYKRQLVYYAIALLLKSLLARVRFLCINFKANLIAHGTALLVSLFFMLLVGVESSSLRAGLAIVFVVFSKQFERGRGMLNSIFFALILLCALWPQCFLEPGVQLTFAALLGICAALHHGAETTVGQAVRISFYASLFTSIVTLFWFNYLSLVGFILNPIAGPLLSAIACKGGFVALVLNYSGVDPTGITLNLVANALACCNNFICIVAEQSWVGIEARGAYKAIIWSTLVAVASYICYYNIRVYRNRG